VWHSLPFAWEHLLDKVANHDVTIFAIMTCQLLLTLSCFVAKACCRRRLIVPFLNKSISLLLPRAPKGLFIGMGRSGFLQRVAKSIFSRGPTVVKFRFNSSEPRKKIFAKKLIEKYQIQNSGEAKPHISPFLRPWGLHTKIKSFNHLFNSCHYGQFHDVSTKKFQQS